MLITIPKEAKGENRVAMTPDTVKRTLNKFKGVKIAVEKGAGKTAYIEDQAFKDAGAVVVSRAEAFSGNIVLTVNAPTKADIKHMTKDTLLIGSLDPSVNAELFKEFAKKGVNALATEKIPRISRAQAMDTLSSQANIAGYMSVLEATNHFNKFFPVMMTAAGSSKPAKVIILGVGVAGLQAIATAKRLGASVEAFDVRPEVAEQVESLGAKFIDLDLDEDGSGEGGYAKELTKEGKEKQQAALQEYLKKADIVITTAQIPGRQAPVLITENAVKGMKDGSVVIDMAAGGFNKANKVDGGNCPLTEADKVTVKHGVTLVGYTDYASRMAGDASAFFSRNLLNILPLLLEVKEEKASLIYNMEDEIIAKSLVVYEGEVK
ncbi:MAG: NAD(P) transhydrogenase subunit alpha [Alphaproteobacteria bacterium]|jgi:NAD(P) transhydrogenase subunit alpha